MRWYVDSATSSKGTLLDAESFTHRAGKTWVFKESL